MIKGLYELFELNWTELNWTSILGLVWIVVFFLVNHFLSFSFPFSGKVSEKMLVFCELVEKESKRYNNNNLSEDFALNKGWRSTRKKVGSSTKCIDGYNWGCKYRCFLTLFCLFLSSNIKVVFFFFFFLIN